jgi:hypothetical protein
MALSPRLGFGSTVQAVKPLHALGKLRGKRHRRLEHHAPPHIRWSGRRAVEAEPRLRIDDLAFAIDKVSDSESVVTQINCDLPSPAKSEQLTLNRPLGRVVESHRRERFVAPIFVRRSSPCLEKNLKRL